MTTPTTPPGAIVEMLSEIKRRRAAAPTKQEIQRAITAALVAGFTVRDIANLTGIPRQQFYQAGYDLSANRLARRSPPSGETIAD